MNDNHEPGPFRRAYDIFEIAEGVLELGFELVSLLADLISML